jgi:hypothetical protein
MRLPTPRSVAALGALAILPLTAPRLGAQIGASTQECNLGRRVIEVGADSTVRRRGPRFECEMLARSVTRPDGRQTHWMSAVVLWRVPRARRMRADDPEARRRTDSIEAVTRAYDRAAEDSGRLTIGGFNGTVHYQAMLDREYRTLYVGDQRFAIPLRDSALVVMVDQTRDAAQTPVVVGTASIPAALPESFWPKFWVHGDTTFHVQPRDDQSVLIALRAHPRIRAFLESP